MTRRYLPHALVAGAVALAAGGVVAGRQVADQAAAPTSCTRTLAAGGNLPAFLAAGRRGDVLCLAAGTTFGSPSVANTIPSGVTLTSAPGAMATLVGMTTLRGDHIVLQRVAIDGRNTLGDGGGSTAHGQPGVFIVGDYDQVLDNDITNGHTSNCVYVADPAAAAPVISGNRIHACGYPANPEGRLHHGIYLGHARDAVIADNTISDVTGYGIQVYPDAQRTLVARNLVVGAKLSAIVIGSESGATSGTQVTGNILSSVEQPIRTWWGSGAAGANSASGNCLAGSPAQGSWPGLALGANLTVASAGIGADGMLASTSPCLGYGPAEIQPAAAPPATTDTPGTTVIPPTTPSVSTSTSPTNGTTPTVSAPVLPDIVGDIAALKAQMDARLPRSRQNAAVRAAFNRLAQDARFVLAVALQPASP